MVLVLAGAVTLVLQRGAGPARKLSRTPVVEAVLADPGSPRAGAARPDVVVVVFTDYRCPVCRRTDPALGRLLAADRGVQVIYKDWPILGPDSQAAARLALAAHGQGRYPAMHAALMELRGPLDDAGVDRAVRAAGIDRMRLMRDLAANDAAYAAQLARHGMQAWSLGLRGTPAYLVGPYLIEGGLDDAALRRAVRKARAARGWAQAEAPAGRSRGAASISTAMATAMPPAMMKAGP